MRGGGGEKEERGSREMEGREGWVVQRDGG